MIDPRTEFTLEVGTVVTWREVGFRGRTYGGTITHGCGDLFQAIITHSNEPDPRDIGWHRNFYRECLLSAEAPPSPKEPMSTIAKAAPAKNSAPNNAEAKAAAPDKKAWSAEIHTPAGEYNANIPVADIVPDWQNRRAEDPEEDASLAASIKADGLVQPITVRPAPKFPKAFTVRHVVDKKEIFRVFKQVFPCKLETDLLYESSDKRDAHRAELIYKSGAGWQIIAGERRWRAHVANGAKTIRGFINKGETDATAAVKQTVENSARLDLNPIQEARQMKRLSDLGIPQKEIGQRFGGKSQPVVAHALKLLLLPEEVQQMIQAGKLTASHGLELVRFAQWPKICSRIADLVHAHSWDAKMVREDSLPFGNTLESNDGLVAGITMDQGYDWETRPTYKIPATLQKDPDFIIGKSRSYYILPQKPETPNKWAPEKERQDAARTKKEEAKADRAATSSSKESADRARVIEKNKKRRAALKIDLERALEKLAKLKQPGVNELAVLAKHAIGGGYGSVRIHEVADALGLKVPAGAIAGEHCYGFGSIDALMKMSAADIAKLAVGVIMHKDVDDLCKEPQGFVPHSLKVYGVEGKS
jgi:ParB/RepB/Spo0J family partition protein